MSDALDYLRDRWDSDTHFRSQIVLAIVLGSIGLVFAWLDGRVRAAA